MKEQKKGKKKGLKIFGIIVLAFVLLIVFFIAKMAISMGQDMKKLEFNEIDMEKVADGTYDGTAETTLVKVDVTVTVTDHKIADIQITRHENGKGTPAEVITQTMIEKNTYDVDTVSGATASSNTIKSAVNNALSKGVQ